LEKLGKLSATNKQRKTDKVVAADEANKKEISLVSGAA
jgi:hypothetical protein